MDGQKRRVNEAHLYPPGCPGGPVVAIRVRGSILVVAVVAIVLASFAAVLISHLYPELGESSQAGSGRPRQGLEISKPFPRPDRDRPQISRQPEPRAVEARTAVIRRDAAAIEAECQRAAGGDWDAWQVATAPYRAALTARVQGLKRLGISEYDPQASRYEPLAGRDDFPLFEIDPPDNLNYLYEPATLDDFRQHCPVRSICRWLRRQGIDLIFVPVPKMTEVYVEHFLDPCPADGIIGPHVRHTLLELLGQDVEVIDALPMFRPLRDTPGDFLYNTADTHWSLRAMRIVAKEVAGRIGRYEFGRAAQAAPPFVKVVPGEFALAHVLPHPPGRRIAPSNGIETLSERQKQIADTGQPRHFEDLFLPDGKSVRNEPHSPVLVIGNSFADYFCDQLVKEMNLPITWRIGHNTTTEAFCDFLREPELLAYCRVVVWVIADQHMTRFKTLPGPVTAE
jgi:hypothetical protein